MSYSSSEYSAQGGDPVYRYEFSVGGTLYRRTSETNIVLDSAASWIPSPITPSEFSQTNELAKDPLKLTLPRTDELSVLFIGGVPNQITTVTVYKGHQGDTSEEFRSYWKGRVTGTSLENDAVTLECENIFSSMRRTGLRARYQKNCRHALYQRGCNLNDYDFATTASIISSSGNVITVTDVLDSVGASGYYTGGMVELSTGERQYITKQSGFELTLLLPFRNLEIDSNGVSVTIYPGCDRTLSTCIDKFNNKENFGGFPWIPGKNPFSSSVTGSIA